MQSFRKNKKTRCRNVTINFLQIKEIGDWLRQKNFTTNVKNVITTECFVYLPKNPSDNSTSTQKRCSWGIMANWPGWSNNLFFSEVGQKTVIDKVRRFYFPIVRCTHPIFNKSNAELDSDEFDFAYGYLEILHDWSLSLFHGVRHCRVTTDVTFFYFVPLTKWRSKRIPSTVVIR